mmetsp:Transcript_10612/g.17369  ORF Transcript_10612/g.17369 Transcript_10612/m.17369 type:complete len:88 (-) Transcript_10612:364-627(-)
MNLLNHTLAKPQGNQPSTLEDDKEMHLSIQRFPPSHYYGRINKRKPKREHIKKREKKKFAKLHWRLSRAKKHEQTTKLFSLKVPIKL